MNKWNYNFRQLVFNFFIIILIKKFVQFQESAFQEVRYAIGVQRSFQVLQNKHLPGALFRKIS